MPRRRRMVIRCSLVSFVPSWNIILSAYSPSLYLFGDEQSRALKRPPVFAEPHVYRRSGPPGLVSDWEFGIFVLHFCTIYSCYVLRWADLSSICTILLGPGGI